MTTISDTLKNIPGVDLTMLFDFRKEGLVIVTAVFLSFIFYKAVYLKNIERLKDADVRINAGKAEISRIRAEIQAGEKLMESIHSAQANLARIEQDLRAIKGRLPSERHISGILAEISIPSSVNGPVKDLRILSIKPMQVEEKGGLTRVPLHVSAEGGFVQTGRYLEKIEKLQRIITVDNFMIESKDGGAVLSSQVYLSAYILGPVIP